MERLGVSKASAVSMGEVASSSAVMSLPPMSEPSPFLIDPECTHGLQPTSEPRMITLSCAFPLWLFDLLDSDFTHGWMPTSEPRRLFCTAPHPSSSSRAAAPHGGSW